jgi:hypothetical protein
MQSELQVIVALWREQLGLPNKDHHIEKVWSSSPILGIQRLAIAQKI